MEQTISKRPSRIKKTPVGLSDYDTTREDPQSVTATPKSTPSPVREGAEEQIRSPKRRRIEDTAVPSNTPKARPIPEASAPARSIPEASELSKPKAEAEAEDSGAHEAQGEHAYDNASEDESAAAEPSALMQLPQELLAKILGALPSNYLIQASGACKAFAKACEVVFEHHCRAKRWLPPRRPRGIAAIVKRYPWRYLFRQHACRGCGNPGDFVVRFNLPARLKNTQAFLVCRRCAFSQRERLAAENLCVDLVGLTGRPLLTKKAGEKHRLNFRID